MFRSIALVVFVSSAVFHGSARAQTSGFGTCKPVTQRSAEVGCWILLDHPLGALTGPSVYWYLDSYPNRAGAEKASGPGATVVQALHRTWLLTISPKAPNTARKGKRVAQIGPIPVDSGKKYSALFMEAVLNPGMKSAIHSHSGPEAWYTEKGETCLETPKGKLLGRPGGPSVIVPAGSPMQLTASGTMRRYSLVLILHHSEMPATTMVDDWKPKGLCDKP